MCVFNTKSNHTFCGANSFAPSSRSAVNEAILADTALAVSVLFFLLGALMLNAKLLVGMLIIFLGTTKLKSKQTDNSK